MREGDTTTLSRINTVTRKEAVSTLRTQGRGRRNYLLADVGRIRDSFGAIVGSPSLILAH